MTALGFVDSPGIHRQEPLVRGGLHIVGREQATLHRDHGDVLRRYALRLCRTPSDADDLVQDTLTRALASWATLQPGTNTRGWLLSILHNVFIDSCRRQKQQGSPVSAAHAQELPSPEPEVEPRWALVTQAQVTTALDKLDPPFREVYRLHAQGHGNGEISRSLGIPRMTVGTRLMRARKKLRVLLFGEDENDA